MKAERSYPARLADEALRAAFLEYAGAKGLPTDTYGPHRAWSNGLTTAHFAAFAWAWEKGGGAVGEVPDPVGFLLARRARSWYEQEVAAAAADEDAVLPPWDELEEAEREFVLAAREASCGEDEGVRAVLDRHLARSRGGPGR